MIIDNSLLKPNLKIDQTATVTCTPLVQAIMSQFKQLKRSSFYFNKQEYMPKGILPDDTPQHRPAKSVRDSTTKNPFDSQPKSWVMNSSAQKPPALDMNTNNPLSIARS